MILLLISNKVFIQCTVTVLDDILADRSATAMALYMYWSMLKLVRQCVLKRNMTSIFTAIQTLHINAALNVYRLVNFALTHLKRWYYASLSNNK